MVLKGLTVKESLLKCAEMWKKVAIYPPTSAPGADLKIRAIVEMGYSPYLDVEVPDENYIVRNCFLCNIFNLPTEKPNGCDRCNSLMVWGPKELTDSLCACNAERSPYALWLYSLRLDPLHSQQYALEIARRTRVAANTLPE